MCTVCTVTDYLLLDFYNCGTPLTSSYLTDSDYPALMFAVICKTEAGCLLVMHSKIHVHL